MQRFNWHIDAIKNGGASFLDCIKIELNILFNKQFFKL